MNTVLSTRVDQQHYQQHPPSPQHPVTSPRVVTIADRVALHLGLALITWNRRPHTAAKTPRDYNPSQRREQAAARAARERNGCA